MSLQHPDPASYLSALRFRGGATIVVEGPTDKRALARALHEFERDRRVARGSVLIDSVDCVGGFGAGLGNRERAEALQAMAQTAGLSAYVLVDREFRGFDTNGTEFRDLIQTHHQPHPGAAWTRGHSIENYFFEVEYVQEYLRFRYSDQLTSGAIEDLAEFWQQVVRQSAAYSLAIRDANAIGRMSGALPVDAWVTDQPNLAKLDTAKIQVAALGRGMPPDGVRHLLALFQQYASAAAACEDLECCRWLAHGHLGDEVIWLAVAQLLSRTSVIDRTTVDEIARGRTEEKACHRADRWAALHRGTIRTTTPEPLWRAVGVRI